VRGAAEAEGIDGGADLEPSRSGFLRRRCSARHGGAPGQVEATRGGRWTRERRRRIGRGGQIDPECVREIERREGGNWWKLGLGTGQGRSRGRPSRAPGGLDGRPVAIGAVDDRSVSTGVEVNRGRG
jgi:hypothetical protein